MTDHRNYLRTVPLVLCVPPIASGAESRPRIRLIMVDDRGYSDIGCSGGTIRTHTVDALAKNGGRPGRLFNWAQCRPSRVSLMSGPPAA